MAKNPSEIKRPDPFAVKKGGEVTVGYPGELARWLGDVFLYFTHTRPEVFKTQEGAELPVDIKEYLESNPALILSFVHLFADFAEFRFEVSTEENYLKVKITEKILEIGDDPKTKVPTEIKENVLTGGINGNREDNDNMLLQTHAPLGLKTEFLGAEPKNKNIDWFNAIIYYLNKLLWEDAHNAK